ncbi:MAG: Hpt domain-containing protein [Desulfobulbus sp.]|jgi:HPt (histidine-containing phosphotransfer) domain-containing protein|nr:Hpt domain-containing protein [Desulfobulbus sp.]
MAELQWDRTAAQADTAGDATLLEELLILFREAAATDLDLLRQAVAEEDGAAAVAAAHSLKGAAASLGVESISSLAEAVERSGPTGAIPIARKTLPLLADLLIQLNAL